MSKNPVVSIVTLGEDMNNAEHEHERSSLLVGNEVADGDTDDANDGYSGDSEDRKNDSEKSGHNGESDDGQDEEGQPLISRATTGVSRRSSERQRRPSITRWVELRSKRSVQSRKMRRIRGACTQLLRLKRGKHGYGTMSCVDADSVSSDRRSSLWHGKCGRTTLEIQRKATFVHKTSPLTVDTDSEAEASSHSSDTPWGLRDDHNPSIVEITSKSPMRRVCKLARHMFGAGCKGQWTRMEQTVPSEEFAASSNTSDAPSGIPARRDFQFARDDYIGFLTGQARLSNASSDSFDRASFSSSS